MIKSFRNFNEVNEFLARNNCIVRSIDPGVTKIYVEIEEVSDDASSKPVVEESISEYIEEFISLGFLKVRPIDNAIRPNYDKLEAFADYIESSCDNPTKIMAAVISIANLDRYDREKNQ